MSSHPLVSVLIPAYNHEKFITECLESVATQTHPEIEVLVFDDGSTDGTKAVIESFLSNTSRPVFNFVSKPNEGLCATLNAGLCKARGAYIAIIASDDAWLPEKLARQVRVMEENPEIGLVFSDTYFIRGTQLTSERWTDYKRMFQGFFQHGKALPGSYERLMVCNFIPALTVLLRKSVIDAVGPFDQKLVYEDYDMWLRIARISNIAFLDEPLAKYRMHETNISNDALFMLKGYFQTILKHIREEPLKSHPFRAAKVIFHAVSVIAFSRIKKFFLRRRYQGS